MPTLNCCFPVWCCSQPPLRNRRTTVVVCYWREWERAVYSLALSSKLNRRNKNSASSRTSATKMFPWSLCSDRISAVGFPCDLWTSTRSTQKHMSGVRRCSVSAYYTGMMTGVWVPNTFIKKKKTGTAVHTCNPKARRQRQEDPWAIASHFTWTTKKTPGAVRVSTPKHA